LFVAAVEWPSGRSSTERGRWRIGGHQPEHARLGPQQRHIGQAVPADCQTEGEVEQHFAGSCTAIRNRHR
jgi:hypothetical protein